MKENLVSPTSFRLDQALMKRVRVRCAEMEISQQDAVALALEQWMLGYPQNQTANDYELPHTRGLEPMEWWKQLAGIGQTWIRLQLAALAHAAGAGVRIRTAQAVNRTAQPSE